jgi:RNA polymerase sigma-70 factor (ECF subfamily)
MPAEEPRDITQLLLAWKKGDEGALSDLMPIVYPELRRIAGRYLSRRAPNQTLESAGLANEAYLRLVRAQGIRCDDRGHFFALCGQMIRRILVDHARHRQYAKRGGARVHVSLDEALPEPGAEAVDMLALDEALCSLSRIDARKVRVVEMRFFGGLSVEETATVLEISEETVTRDWNFAKAWLVARLR